MQRSSNIGYLFNHLAFVLARGSDQILQEKLNIGFSQYKIMMVLESNPAVKQKQIAQFLGQTEASISRQIKLLQAKGLITTKIRQDNKREHITTLTTKGERQVARATQILNSHHSPTFANISASQLEDFRATLNQLHEAACQSKATLNH